MTDFVNEIREIELEATVKLCGTPDFDGSTLTLQKKKSHRQNKLEQVNAQLKTLVEDGKMDWGILVLKIGEYSVQLILLPTFSDLSRFTQWYEADFYPGLIILNNCNFVIFSI